ncbi:unnamed protein product [Effrenium voratum]|uniref:Peptidyl-tRNA hydrolase n=1 Tax=Effrenium voratum TaxID=2562239 RepID=A0AA36I511_9DINO|nr:unnamed protein product [Effrenium voratum]CAJ1433558.1 unnamed protein product [Effrenium voratum]
MDEPPQKRARHANESVTCTSAAKVPEAAQEAEAREAEAAEASDAANSTLRAESAGLLAELAGRTSTHPDGNNAKQTLAVLGLGNPDGLSRRERHSLGARVVAALADSACSSSLRLLESDCKDLAGAKWLTRGGTKALLLQPTRPINDSGLQLRSALDTLELLTTPFLAIVDDCWLPLGSIRFREKGSSGGHKGLEGIEAIFGKQHYHRLRLGIGGKNLKEFVTGSFTDEEESLLQPVISAAVSAVETWLSLGPSAAQKIMSIVNAPTFVKQPPPPVPSRS